MTWYAASILIAIRPIGEDVLPISVCENVVIVEADTSSDALSEARRIGMEEASVDDDLEDNGRPAKRHFLGIRKLINVSNRYPLDLDKDQPASGTEVTYSTFEVSSEEDLKKMINGESVSVLYVE